MGKHTPTLWFVMEGKSYIFHTWNSMSCAVLRSLGAVLEWHENPQKSNEESWENLKRATACVNAFHSSEGREIATEQITEGLVWEMVDGLKQAEEWLEGWASAEPYISEIRALLAKLEPKG